MIIKIITLDAIETYNNNNSLKCQKKYNNSKKKKVCI